MVRGHVSVFRRVIKTHLRLLRDVRKVRWCTLHGEGVWNVSGGLPSTCLAAGMLHSLPGGCRFSPVSTQGRRHPDQMVHDTEPSL